MFKGKRREKFFPGNKKQSMQRAHNWVVAEKKKLGQVFSLKGPRSTYSNRKQKLPLGVTISNSARKQCYGPYWQAVAYANINGKQHKKYFSFAKFGKDLAIAMAIAQRQKWVRQLKEKWESG